MRNTICMEKLLHILEFSLIFLAHSYSLHLVFMTYTYARVANKAAKSYNFPVKTSDKLHFWCVIMKNAGKLILCWGITITPVIRGKVCYIVLIYCKFYLPWNFPNYSTCQLIRYYDRKRNYCDVDGAIVGMISLSGYPFFVRLYINNIFLLWKIRYVILFILKKIEVAICVIKKETAEFLEKFQSILASEAIVPR